MALPSWVLGTGAASFGSQHQADGLCSSWKKTQTNTDTHPPADDIPLRISKIQQLTGPVVVLGREVSEWNMVSGERIQMLQPPSFPNIFDHTMCVCVCVVKDMHLSVCVFENEASIKSVLMQYLYIVSVLYKSHPVVSASHSDRESRPEGWMDATCYETGLLSCNISVGVECAPGLMLAHVRVCLHGFVHMWGKKTPT